MNSEAPYRRPIALAILLIIGGSLALLAAFELTIDKFQVLEHPETLKDLSCNYSVLVQCGKNLISPEGSAFGFPNPVIGLMGFPAAISVGVATLAGARFARWFWALFNLGLAGAIAFVMWLITVSIFHLNTLCPWCMLVWVSVIPMVIAVTLYNISQGNLPLGRTARRAATAAYSWTPLIVLVVIVILATIAQVNLDVIHRL